jgi:hypothetical protein
MRPRPGCNAPCPKDLGPKDLGPKDLGPKDLDPKDLDPKVLAEVLARRAQRQ